MPELTQDQRTGLEKLRLPFEDNLRSFKPIAKCSSDEYKSLPKAMCKICGTYHATSKTDHLEYVGHAALTKRLLDTDIGWSWEPVAVDEHGLPRFDADGGLWIKLTVCGMTRLGYGQAVTNKYAEIGQRIKEIIGDAMRNAGMRFGMALELWHKGDFETEDPIEQQSEGKKKDGIQMPKSAGKTKPVESSVAQSAQSAAPDPADGEPLAEAGEALFISKKLSALKHTDPDVLMKSIGITTLDGLTKANFEKLKEAIKGKK